MTANNAEIHNNPLVTTSCGLERHTGPLVGKLKDLGIKTHGVLGKAKPFGSRESLPGMIVCEATEEYVGGTCDGPKSKVRPLGGVLIDPPLVDITDPLTDVEITTKVGLCPGIRPPTAADEI